MYKKTVSKSEGGSKWIGIFQQHMDNADTAVVNHISAEYITRKMVEKQTRTTLGSWDPGSRGTFIKIPKVRNN